MSRLLTLVVFFVLLVLIVSATENISLEDSSLINTNNESVSIENNSIENDNLSNVSNVPIFIETGVNKIQANELINTEDVVDNSTTIASAQSIDSKSDSVSVNSESIPSEKTKAVTASFGVYLEIVD